MRAAESTGRVIVGDDKREGAGAQFTKGSEGHPVGDMGERKGLRQRRFWGRREQVPQSNGVLILKFLFEYLW